MFPALYVTGEHGTLSQKGYGQGKGKWGTYSRGWLNVWYLWWHVEMLQIVTLFASRCHCVCHYPLHLPWLLVVPPEMSRLMSGQLCLGETLQQIWRRWRCYATTCDICSGIQEYRCCCVGETSLLLRLFRQGRCLCRCFEAMLQQMPLFCGTAYSAIWRKGHCLLGNSNAVTFDNNYFLKVGFVILLWSIFLLNCLQRID